MFGCRSNLLARKVEFTVAAQRNVYQDHHQHNIKEDSNIISASQAASRGKSYLCNVTFLHNAMYMFSFTLNSININYNATSWPLFELKLSSVVFALRLLIAYKERKLKIHKIIDPV